MNTPKTPKPPIRWKPPKTRSTSEKGGYYGIKEPNAAAIFGWLISYWPHVEEQIIEVFEELISGKRAHHDQAVGQASREIFRSIVSQELRIKIMKSLLEAAPHKGIIPLTQVDRIASL